MEPARNILAATIPPGKYFNHGWTRMDTDGPNAAEPPPLPLLHPMEERAGVRRDIFRKLPLTPTLSPLLRRGERELTRRPNSLSITREFSSD